MSPEDGTGDVHISNKEIWLSLEEAKDRIGELSHKLDTALRDLDDLRNRTRALELKFYGILAALGAAVIVILRLSGVSIV